MAAAGSDARMNGCELPVIINSGSGNQGITVSVPVIVYAKELGVSEEKMYRALVLSNLTAIHQKTPIGRLSAYCGAVSAGCGAGAGIAYVPLMWVINEINRGEVEILLPRYQSDPRPVYALYTEKDKLPLKVQVVINYLTDYFVDVAQLFQGMYGRGKEK